MCLAIPAEILEINDGVATCKVGEGDTTVQASIMLLDEDVTPGDYIIIHAGFALRKLDHKEAQETLKILRDMVELLGGDNYRHEML
ncbi:MAG: HypC/HybG/HupF family hydrogenase formation chaperone [Pseudodesulfovibrio sp.]|jgi:hydrogenase expression/formation protein HypC|uniref:Hydrogenase assembly chaperone hypC/hupF n=1 Tax=Pseudodesulfovibrio aespoeensis (strain ATCC 700646 / DSM 10631 / Aspo-2) TaxID=643562 RepID=E6VVM5_PSEA9|nr:MULTISPECIES: HypC/HybG/HupF family hydrogenase formation chaperone [Pseudodesulfovibrio]MBU4191946.1 HypC/HybG/HupF family hydrogenase formation chaperone [Pseudomonadota bacterium]ADU63583.1 hydrogenase assembly chaperone hypC/hupF [Pseudodesulfovibrio aespoeensis Aspo-2]MBU4243561.1 HypC/HybG/HupF family hydrogenase formation chaperone [Pseudomonadota bacterium]MBU4378508.1 HypC/HybG/HupF family hydrogenase formation chaperone [Pseudomonadota bacterium]MBU4475308.1 HypC/HybG/HupF family 